MTRELTQAEFEDLSAYLDGELPEGRAGEVGQLLESDPAWQLARRELATLDSLLDSFTVPSAPADLAGRIGRDVPNRPRRRLAIWLAVPAAAAAAIVIAVTFFSEAPSTPRTRENGTVVALPTDRDVQAAAKRLAPENVDLLRDYDVLTNFETIEAIERLDNEI